jgi:hypothetical protein
VAPCIYSIAVVAAAAASACTATGYIYVTGSPSSAFTAAAYVSAWIAAGPIMTPSSYIFLTSYIFSTRIENTHISPLYNNT